MFSAGWRSDIEIKAEKTNSVDRAYAGWGSQNEVAHERPAQLAIDATIVKAMPDINFFERR